MAEQVTALVGQSGGATMAINASLVGVVRAAQAAGIDQLYGMRFGVQGLLAGDTVPLLQLDEATLASLTTTPSAALGTCRYKLTEQDPQLIVERCRQLRARYFFYIGGNDSADTSHRIAEAAAQAGYELFVVGIPKTIDNDLPITDHCPGYGSSARFIAAAVAAAGRDTEAHQRIDPIKVVEVMGRNAGWLTAAAALAKQDEQDAPQLIYPPERPVSLERILTDIERVYRRLGYAVVVVPETLRDPDGKPLAEAGHTTSDAFGHQRLSGAASRLVAAVERETRLRARFDKPGTLQRACAELASPVDLAEAEQAGRKAVEAALAGVSDVMVTLERLQQQPYRCGFGLAPLLKIANSEKPLPTGYLNTEGTMVTPAFRDYALPLLGEPPLRFPRISV